ncbi:hypothetical protein BDF22DRAFT_682133 [Syncephalis plumigaleata]|nr:hypothetical protein BDF22DRAFT_682133 [Syncephalis plumigaleata]
MYCMRWFIPLLLLPQPTAPPYFVFCYLISYFLHKKPCAYCSALLLALLGSTCYWGTDRCWFDGNGGHWLDPTIRTGHGSNNDSVITDGLSLSL